MHFDFVFMELDIVPLRESVQSYVIRMAGKSSAGTAMLAEVSRESLLTQLACILGGERFRDIELFPTDKEVIAKIRLEQETFTDGERGPDGTPAIWQALPSTTFIWIETPGHGSRYLARLYRWRKPSCCFNRYVIIRKSNCQRPSLKAGKPRSWS